MPAKLIITCDDFGMHSSINAAAEEAFLSEMLTNVSIVANGEKFEDAVNILNKYPDLSVGLHFNIIEGLSIAENHDVFTLLKDNKFYDNHVLFLKDFMFGKINPEHIRNELKAQIKKCKSHGLKLSYIDGHRHLHLFPSILKTIHPILEEEGIRKIRFVNVPFYEYRILEQSKFFASLLFKYSYYQLGKKYISPDWFLGFFDSGNIKLKNIKYWAKNMKEKQSYEIGFHLGDDDRLLKKTFEWDKHYKYNFSWENDLSSLLNKNTQELFKNNSAIKLINYNNLI